MGTSRSPGPYTKGMTDQEKKNFYVLRNQGGQKNKSYSEKESREMATNPSGRLPPIRQGLNRRARTPGQGN